MSRLNVRQGVSQAQHDAIPLPSTDEAFRANILTAVKQDPRRTVSFQQASAFLGSIGQDETSQQSRALLSSITGVAANRFIGQCLRALMDGGEKARILLGYRGTDGKLDGEVVKKIVGSLDTFTPDELRGVSTQDFLELIK